jgi:flagellar biosynthesis/type III secretory pathway chaperone
MNIINMLTSQKEVLTSLLEILNKERDALIHEDIDDIVEFQEKKIELKQKIDDIEENRQEIYGDKRLKEILESMKGQNRQKAEKLGSEVEELAAEIIKINDINDMLVRQSLDYIRTMIDFLTPKKVTVYKSTGKVDSSAAPSSVINKSV